MKIPDKERMTFCWQLWPFGNGLWFIAYGDEFVLRTKNGRIWEYAR